MRSQHCGYWCPGAKAPGHQYPQCWLNINCIGPVSSKTIAHKVNSIRKWNHILKKKWPSRWDRVTHICINRPTRIGSDNGLSAGRHQAIFWTNAGVLLVGTLGTTFSEILIEIHIFPFTKMHLKMSSGKWRLFCLGLNGLTLGEVVDISSE